MPTIWKKFQIEIKRHYLTLRKLIPQFASEGKVSVAIDDSLEQACKIVVNEH